MEKLEVLMLVVAACLIGVLVGSAATFAVMQRSYSVSTSGTIVGVNVGVFADSACSQNMTAIDWGTVYPGASVSRIAYVKNTGNALITLSMATADWVPAMANDPVNLAWNVEGVVLDPGQVVAATFSLSVSQSISGITDFSVNVIITGSG